MSLDIDLKDNVCYCCGRSDIVYSANITHNLTDMADALGIYKCVWRPDENGFRCAKDLVEPLEKAINVLGNNMADFLQYEPENKWGTAETFLPWLKSLLSACEKNPGAVIEVCR